MGEVGFYHLGPTALDRALPRLLERALADGHRVVVFAGSAERVTYLDGLLWTYNEASFLPHGTARDGNAARQPICLTDRTRTPTAPRCWCCSTACARSISATSPAAATCSTATTRRRSRLRVSDGAPRNRRVTASPTGNRR